MDYKDGSKYDALIAIWVNYFNRKLGVTPPSTPLDPDVIKALLDPNGETKEFTFKDIRQKDLNDPEIAIPLGVRWIFRKKRLSEAKLGRSPTPDEIILEYKGLLKSKSDYQRQALDNFRKNYARLKKSRITASVVLVVILSACATSSYRVIDKKGYRAEIQVTPDRVLLECEDIKDHEDAKNPEGNFGFMIHVLDEENTVLTLIQGPVTTRKFFSNIPKQTTPP